MKIKIIIIYILISLVFSCKKSSSGCPPINESTVYLTNDELKFIPYTKNQVLKFKNQYGDTLVMSPMEKNYYFLPYTNFSYGSGCNTDRTYYQFECDSVYNSRYVISMKYYDTDQFGNPLRVNFKINEKIFLNIRKYLIEEKYFTDSIIYNNKLIRIQNFVLNDTSIFIKYYNKGIFSFKIDSNYWTIYD